MRFLFKSVGGLVLAGLTLGLLVLAAAMVQDAVQTRAAQEPRAPQPRERVFAVNAVLAEETTLNPVLTAFGEVVARRDLELRTAISGRVDWVSPSFEEGGRVSAGQELLRIDPADAEAALDRARADFSDANAEAQNAQSALALAQEEAAQAAAQVALRARALDRQRDLADRGVGSASAVEQAELALSASEATSLARRQAVANAEARVAQAATAQARAELAVREAERNLADTSLTARFDGVLSEVSVREGGIVSNGERVARLIDPTALDVSFRLSTVQYVRLLDADGGLLSLSVTVELETGGGNLNAQGHLDRESAGLGEGQTGRQVFARLDQAAGFKPGDFVTLAIEEPPLSGAIRLPATALAADNTVLIVGEDDRLRPMAVRLLRRQGDDVLVAAEGLNGELVVAERTPLLGEGIKVRVVGENARPEAGEEMLTLSDDERSRLLALVESNERMPQVAKERIIAALQSPQVPASVVARINGAGG